jgi:hypothetical protein
VLLFVATSAYTEDEMEYNSTTKATTHQVEVRYKGADLIGLDTVIGVITTTVEGNLKATIR